MLASVDGAFTELEANDTVIASNGFVGEFVEHTGSDPLVTPLAKRGVRHAVAQETFNVHPCAAGDQADQDALETDPVRDTATMAAERVLIHGPARKQGSTAAQTASTTSGSSTRMMTARF